MWVDSLLHSVGLARRSELDDVLYWRDVFGEDKPKTSSGVTVGRDTAETLAAWYAGTHFIAEQIASLPIVTYSRLPNGGKERAAEDPRYRLLHTEVNPFMSSFSFVETSLLHMFNIGNAFAEIEFNRGGGVKALWLLPPTEVTVKRTLKGPEYHTFAADRSPVVIPHTRMLHFAGPGFDGLLGEAALDAARDSIGTGIAQGRYEAKVYSNGTKIGGVLSTDDPVEAKTYDWMTERFNKAHQGVENSHRHLLLTHGLKWTPMAMSVVDADLIEARKLTVLDIARFLRLPPIILRAGENQTHASVEVERTAVFNDALLHWVRRIEVELERKIGDPDTVMEFLAEGFMRGSTSERYATYRQAREAGIMSLNEIRARENLNPVKGGDVIAVPANLMPLERWLKEPEPEPEPTEDDSEESTDPKLNTSDEDDEPAAEERKQLQDRVTAVVRDALNREMRRALNRAPSDIDKRAEFGDSHFADVDAIRARLHPVATLRGVPDLAERFVTASKQVLGSSSEELPAVWTAAIDGLIQELPQWQ
jgi:HK97 family phage portal protein